MFGTSDRLPKSSVSKPIITFLRVLNVEVKLDETELKSVQNRLGGVVGSRGDAADSLQWLCYAGADRDDRWVLWLLSGEMNGGSVGGFLWRRISPSTSVDPRCGLLGKSAITITLPKPILLGMREPELLHVLGAPTKRQANRYLYVHQHDSKSAGQKESSTSANTVSILLGDGVVRGIEVWQTSFF